MPELRYFDEMYTRLSNQKERLTALMRELYGEHKQFVEDWGWAWDREETYGIVLPMDNSPAGKM